MKLLMLQMDIRQVLQSIQRAQTIRAVQQHGAIVTAKEHSLQWHGVQPHPDATSVIRHCQAGIQAMLYLLHPQCMEALLIIRLQAATISDAVTVILLPFQAMETVPLT